MRQDGSVAKRENPDPEHEQYTTALPQPDMQHPADPPDYQETTILRRPLPPPGSADTSNIPGADRYPAPPTAQQYQPPATLPPAITPPAASPPTAPPPAKPTIPGLRRKPRKLTAIRVAALRSKELTHRGLEKFHGAVGKDGADRSGLSELTYAVMGNYAVDAALAVALANTLFFAAAKAESSGKVLLYLLLTVAPFAVIAPLIGPMLDKLQRGRRFALAASSFGRAILALIMAMNFDSWIIYPCALGMLVLSKSFGVLKAALTPRVLPERITLVKTNSRLSVFGLIAGGVSGGIAAGISGLTTSAGALVFTAICGIMGGWLCLRIPSWVESTEGEVPVSHSMQLQRPRTPRRVQPATARRGMPRIASAALWTNATIRIETGFLTLFIAFVIKSRYQDASVVGETATNVPPPADESGWMQLLLLAAVGAAAGAGGFIGNALGARLPLRHPETVALICLAAVILATTTAFFLPSLITATVVALVGSTGSSLAKVCLDSSIQTNLAESSRASAFGRSEAALQLSWVFGGVLGLLMGGVWTFDGETTVYQVGFGVVTLILLISSIQAVALRLDRNIFPDEGTFAWVGRRLRERKDHKQARLHTDPSSAAATLAARSPAGRRRGQSAGRPRRAGEERN